MRWNRLLVAGLVLTISVNVVQAVRSREATRARVVDLQQRQAESARIAELETIVRVQRDHLARWVLLWSNEPPTKNGWYYLKADGSVSLVYAVAGDVRQGKWAGPLPDAPEPK